MTVKLDSKLMSLCIEMISFSAFVFAKSFWLCHLGVGGDREKELRWNTAKEGKGKGLEPDWRVRDLPCVPTGHSGPALFGPTKGDFGICTLMWFTLTVYEATEILHYLTDWSFLTNKPLRKLRLCCVHIKYSTNCLALLNLSCINRLFVLMTMPLACQMIRKWFWMS